MLLLSIFILLALATDIFLTLSLSWPWWLAVILFVLFAVGYVVVYALLCWLFAIFIPKNDERPPRKFYTAITRITCHFLMAIFNIKPIVIGKEKIAKIPAFLFISNHQSYIDPICQIGCYGRDDLTYIMKDNILKVPLLGNWMCSAGHLPLDRVNNRNAVITIQKSARRIEQGYPIGAYPEGTRSKTKELGEFKDGLFKVAVKTKQPIVVTIIDNAYRLKSRFPWRHTKILLKVCRVIEYEEYQNMNTHAISAMVREIIIRELELARNEYPWLQ